MEKLTFQRIANLCDGDVRGTTPDAMPVTRINTDSRKVQRGELFVALKGDRFNGHDFLEEVRLRGAAGAVAERREMTNRTATIPMVLVDDSLTALQQIARDHRTQFKGKTVAIAGSNGKTGTKEMVAAVLGSQFTVLKNKGNLNNHIGVPLSLLELEPQHEVGVFEVGTNHPGELLLLLNMVRPFAGVITTIGEEHLEFFNDLHGVAQEEGTLAEVLPPDGLLVLNGDDVWSSSIAKRSKSQIVYFGFQDTAQYQASDIHLTSAGTQFHLRTPRGEITIQLSLMGRHQVANALAAAAVGEFFGLSLPQIREGLESIVPCKMRMELRKTNDGILIINDAYNANPSSMRAALDTLCEMPVSGRRIAVLGEMRELGRVSEEAHRTIGQYATQHKVDLIVVVGEGAHPIAEGAKAAATSASQIQLFDTPQEAHQFLKKETHTGDVMLVKASRGAALEQVLEGWE
jgi:UDP-N-acetylmuramoyl-tripeptide--D-alanyl-D-alanine ligase